MEIISQEVDTLKSRTLPFQETLIMPIGDIQWGPACDKARLRRHIEWGAKQKNVYFLGMGDYDDFASPSNRRRVRSLIAGGALYDAAEDTIDEAADKHLGELEDILAPTKGKWLGLLRGHHYWEYQDGTTTDMRLANYLGCPYLGSSAIVNVKFKPPKGETRRHHKPPSFNIWCHHGEGGGQMQSSVINRLERLASAFDMVDVFLMAHHHKKAAAKIQRIRPVFTHADRGKLEHRNVIIAGTGGFLKGYMANSKHAGRPEGNYVEQKALTPVALGGVVIWARPTNNAGYTTVDLDVSI